MIWAIVRNNLGLGLRSLNDRPIAGHEEDRMGNSAARGTRINYSEEGYRVETGDDRCVGVLERCGMDLMFHVSATLRRWGAILSRRVPRGPWAKKQALIFSFGRTDRGRRRRATSDSPTVEWVKFTAQPTVDARTCSKMNGFALLWRALRTRGTLFETPPVRAALPSLCDQATPPPVLRL